MSPRRHGRSPPRSRSRHLGALAAGCCVLVAPVVEAGDELHPRTPVIFVDPPCITVVDRAIDPVLHIDYTIPYEDLKPDYDPDDPATWHEVEDGRTHQFFAFCRDHDPQSPLPLWITWDDVMAAAAIDLIDPAIVDDEDVLSTSTLWDNCWYRITGDDERRLITCDEVAKGVDWDTSGLPVGAYDLEGYTWEPWINLWSLRSGVVLVMDGDDPTPPPPAVAIENNLDFIYSSEPLPLEVCMLAAEGSTLTAYWSYTAADDIAWVPFIEGWPVIAESEVLEFLPPAEVAGKSVMIRIDITDPMGRSATTYANFTIVVLPGDPPGGSGGCEASFVVDPDCESSSGGSASSGDATTGGSDCDTTTGETTGGGSETTGDGTTGGSAGSTTEGLSSGTITDTGGGADATAGASAGGDGGGGDASGCACGLGGAGAGFAGGGPLLGPLGPLGPLGFMGLLGGLLGLGSRRRPR